MADYSLEDLRWLEILGRIIHAAAERAPHPQALQQDLLSPQSTAEEVDQLRERIRELEAAGYLKVDWRSGGGWGARPTTAAQAAWEALESARSNVRARRRQLRDDYLEWVVDQDDAGTSPPVNAFLPTGAAYLGMPYTQEDLEQTGKWLHEAGYIKGPMVYQRPDPLYPTPTAKGRWTIEEGKSVNQPASNETTGAATFTNHFHAPANVAQNSHDVQQTINLGWQDQARELISELSRRLERVENEQARAELAAAADELRTEVDGQARPNVVRGIVTKLGGALTTAAVSEVGSELTQQVFQLLGALPA